ncbi:MAG TPA: LLM class F420-dependent oxidoreductase [Dehalococcoidia bacterium]|nr:LLM class F420-dependent oxidoreductase [Dehalococcoidia bacterium]
MKFGAFIFPTDYSIQPVELAKALEERGHESGWLAEHTHIPKSRETPYPGGGDLPKQYYDTYDPFVTLTAMAVVTEKLKLGTGISLIIERDPIVLAKVVSSLDQISNGRVLLGIGGGWNREEMSNHGTDPTRRWKLLRERIEAMKVIWTENEPEYHGEFVDFDPIYQWPKPVQKPHPPIIMGNAGEGALRRVVQYCDGWIPIGGRTNMEERIQELRRLAREAGREEIPVTLFGAQPTAEAIETAQAMGVDRCVIPLPAAPAEEVLPLLDKQAELIQKFS